MIENTVKDTVHQITGMYGKSITASYLEKGKKISYEELVLLKQEKNDVKENSLTLIKQCAARSIRDFDTFFDTFRNAIGPDYKVNLITMTDKVHYVDDHKPNKHGRYDETLSFEVYTKYQDFYSPYIFTERKNRFVNATSYYVKNMHAEKWEQARGKDGHPKRVATTKHINAFVFINLVSHESNKICSVNGNSLISKEPDFNKQKQLKDKLIESRNNKRLDRDFPEHCCKRTEKTLKTKVADVVGFYCFAFDNDYCYDVPVSYRNQRKKVLEYEKKFGLEFSLRVIVAHGQHRYKLFNQMYVPEPDGVHQVVTRTAYTNCYRLILLTLSVVDKHVDLNVSLANLMLRVPGEIQYKPEMDKYVIPWLDVDNMNRKGQSIEEIMQEFRAMAKKLERNDIVEMIDDQLMNLDTDENVFLRYEARHNCTSRIENWIPARGTQCCKEFMLAIKKHNKKQFLQYANLFSINEGTQPYEAYEEKTYMTDEEFKLKFNKAFPISKLFGLKKNKLMPRLGNRFGRNETTSLVYGAKLKNASDGNELLNDDSFGTTDHHDTIDMIANYVKMDYMQVLTNLEEMSNVVVVRNHEEKSVEAIDSMKAKLEEACERLKGTSSSKVARKAKKDFFKLADHLYRTDYKSDRCLNDNCYTLEMKELQKFLKKTCEARRTMNFLCILGITSKYRVYGSSTLMFGVDSPAVCINDISVDEIVANIEKVALPYVGAGKRFKGIDRKNLTKKQICSIYGYKAMEACNIKTDHDVVKSHENAVFDKKKTSWLIEYSRRRNNFGEVMKDINAATDQDNDDPLPLEYCHELLTYMFDYFYKLSDKWRKNNSFMIHLLYKRHCEINNLLLLKEQRVANF